MDIQQAGYVHYKKNGRMHGTRVIEILAENVDYWTKNKYDKLIEVIELYY